MSRRPNIMRPTYLRTAIPEDIRVKLDLYLWSDLEQRIPLGAYQRFFMERVEEFFSRKALDIGNGLVVYGTPEAIAFLRKTS